MISIVIPIYNASDGLRRCLDSIVNQTFKEYEVWLINDGSTDSSGAICDEYVKNHKEFSVYHSENHGVSVARNIGIEKAEGDFITFIDADDYVEKTFLETLFPNNDEDISVCGHKVVRFNLKSEIVTPQFTSIEGLINSPMIRSVWGKLFKTKLIKDAGIKFDTTLGIGEDTLFTLICLNHVNSLKIKTEIEYVYFSPRYNINKYKTLPADLISLRKKFRVQELILKNSSYDIGRLNESNTKILAFNLLTVLYLSEMYRFSERRKYLLEFADETSGESIGLSKRLNKIYNLLKRTKNERLADLFILIMIKSMWFKSRIIRN